MKKYFILMVMCWAFSVANADIKRPKSYNYTRGLEEYQQDNLDEAMKFFDKEIQENPKNGYTYMWKGIIHYGMSENGQALNALNTSLKYLPKKDAEFVAATYNARAMVYMALEDTVKALDDYSMAIKIDPKTPSFYDERAELYYALKEYDLSDADYKKETELDAGSVMGYMGLGRNCNDRKRWKEAIDYFTYVTKLNGEYSSAYSFRAESYMGLKDWNKATDDVVTALTLDTDGTDRMVYSIIEDMNETCLKSLETKIKILMKTSPNNARWPYLLGAAFSNAERYKKALEYYKKSLELDAYPETMFNISYAYAELGDTRSALKYIDMAQQQDSTIYKYIFAKADYLYYDGQTDEAIKEMGRYIENQPKDPNGYYRRGFFNDNAGLVDDAIEDYTTSIILLPDYAYAYLGRGDQYVKKGENELARADYLKVVELDTVPNLSSCAMYAYLSLGEKDKAVAFMDDYMAKFPNNAGVFYDASCLYARMGECTKSLDYLKESFEKGYHEFSHIALDDDMDAIRNLPEFKALIDEYKQKMETETEPMAESDGEDVVTEVPFTKYGGNLCQVKCSINGLPLHFIFDTGASSVSLSQTEATFMMKNGYLDMKDVVGNQYFTDANGNVNVGTEILIRDVDFGGLKLSNVKASVVNNQKAPLLLGQSVFGKLGKIEIDNARSVLKITHKKMK